MPKYMSYKYTCTSNTAVAEPEVSTRLLPNHVTEHDPGPVPSASYPHNLRS
jgi:hypothetical protein